MYIKEKRRKKNGKGTEKKRSEKEGSTYRHHDCLSLISSEEKKSKPFRNR